MELRQILDGVESLEMVIRIPKNMFGQLKMPNNL